MTPEEIPAAHRAILDKAAGKTHSATGPVMTCLAEILTAHEADVRAAIADEIERIIGIDPPIDDQDQDIRNVVRHLRGLCTICGRAPDAEPCGHAHAINLRGDQ